MQTRESNTDRAVWNCCIISIGIVINIQNKYLQAILSILAPDKLSPSELTLNLGLRRIEQLGKCLKFEPGQICRRGWPDTRSS